jgi:hypothetical protein
MSGGGFTAESTKNSAVEPGEQGITSIWDHPAGHDARPDLRFKAF